MSIDLRCRHDRSVRELAAGMFDEGRGCDSVAKSLGIPARAVRKWQQTYRAVGGTGCSVAPEFPGSIASPLAWESSALEALGFC